MGEIDQFLNLMGVFKALPCPAPLPFSLLPLDGSLDGNPLCEYDRVSLFVQCVT